MSLKIFNDWVEEIQLAEVGPLLLAGVTFSARHRRGACRQEVTTQTCSNPESFGHRRHSARLRCESLEEAETDVLRSHRCMGLIDFLCSLLVQLKYYTYTISIY